MKSVHNYIKRFKPGVLNTGKIDFLIIGLSFFILIALRLLILDIPLNVDEGYWAYTASMMIKGQTLYTDIWNTNPLFLYLPYIISEKLFGHGLHFLRLTGIFINILTLVIIFKLTRNTLGKMTGIICLILASVYTISFQLNGHFLLNSEHLSQFPLFVSFYFLHLFFRNNCQYKSVYIFLSGLFLGIV